MVSPRNPRKHPAGALSDLPPSYKEVLTEQARFLTPLSDDLVSRWTELYHTTFGKESFFSVERVREIFNQLTTSFIGCLHKQRLEAYFDDLQEKGQELSQLGVPFEEVIISLHLFEEVCLEQFLVAYPKRAKLGALLLGLEEIHSHGLACLANSYFENARIDMERVTDAVREDNELLKTELSRARDSLFKMTSQEIHAMHGTLDRMNGKLKHRLHQLSRLHRLSQALEGEAEMAKLLGIASEQLLQLLPPNSDVYFGFFDEAKHGVNIFNQAEKNVPQCEWIKSFYFSELAEPLRDALYRKTEHPAIFKEKALFPQALQGFFTIRNQHEFLLFPIKNFDHVAGFILLATHEPNHFTRHNHKFYQRLSQVVGKAATSAQNYRHYLKDVRAARSQEKSALKEEPNERPEEILSRCLGALMDLVGAERSSVMRYDALRKELKVFAAKGSHVYPIAGAPLKWGKGAAGTALKELKPVHIERMKRKGPRDFLAGLLKGRAGRRKRVKSLLCVPLVQSNRPLGVVNLSTINYYQTFRAADIRRTEPIVNRISEVLDGLEGENFPERQPLGT